MGEGVLELWGVREGKGRRDGQEDNEGREGDLQAQGKEGEMKRKKGRVSEEGECRTQEVRGGGWWW